MTRFEKEDEFLRRVLDAAMERVLGLDAANRGGSTMTEQGQRQWVTARVQRANAAMVDALEKAADRAADAYDAAAEAGVSGARLDVLQDDMERADECLRRATEAR